MMQEKPIKSVVRARRQSLRLAFAITWLAAIAAVLAVMMDSGVAEDRDPRAAAFRTGDLIVDNVMTLGSGSAVFRQYTGNPNAAVGAVQGSLILDTSTPAVWYNSTGSNVWVQLGSGGGGGGGSGFTIAGWGLVGSGSTIGMGSAGCPTGGVWTWTGTTFACQLPGTLGSGSIGMTIGSATSPIALPTLGTTDWIHSLAAGTAGTRSISCNAGTTSTCWMKQAGGVIVDSGGMDWVGLSFASPATVAGLWTFTAGSADSMTTTALSSTQVSVVSASGTTGMGPRFVLPSIGGNVQRVARIYLYQYDNLATCVATAIDGTAAGSSVTNDTGSGGVVSQTVLTVTYKTNYSAPVVVICTVTTTRTGAGNPAIGWAAYTIGLT